MAFVFDVKVFPSSGRIEWKLEPENLLKCYVRAQAHKGQANKELLTLIARALKISPSACSIISGLTSGKKRIRVNAPRSFEDLCIALGLELQKPA